MKLRFLCIFVFLLIPLIGHVHGYVEHPQAKGDLVYRDTEGKIYGRDGDDCDLLIPIYRVKPAYTGHVGIYTGDDTIVEAWGWIGEDSEVCEIPYKETPGQRSFYTNEQGDRVHNPLGAKTHRGLRNNSDAIALRDMIVQHAKDRVGEDYDSNFSKQKGDPNHDGEWTCCGLAEKVYESSGSQSLVWHSNYGDDYLYEGGLDITPDGYYPKLDPISCYFQTNVEFSQIAKTFVIGREFGFPSRQFIFFPYTQFQQPSLIDSFAVRKPEPEIKANNQDSVVVVPDSPVSITVSLDPGDYAGQNADWWVASDTPFGWYTYVYPRGWSPRINICIQAGLFDLSPPVEILNQTLPIGRYIFYFALDNPDGAATGPWWGLDSVEVNVQENRSPTTTITSPSDGTIFTEGNAASFIGAGTDPEDGQLTGNSLVWTSNKDGQIGTGQSFTKTNLSVNTHTITLTAKDSKGATGTDSVTITVASTPYCDPHEPNGSFAQARYLGDSQGGSFYKELGINSYICSASDVDYFKIVVNNSVFMLFVSEGEVYYGKDYDIYLYDSSYNEIAKSATRPLAGGVNIETINYLNPSQGIYYIKVVGYNGAYATDKTYTLGIMFYYD